VRHMRGRWTLEAHTAIEELEAAIVVLEKKNVLNHETTTLILFRERFSLTVT
jgi:hypothetical protein